MNQSFLALATIKRAIHSSVMHFLIYVRTIKANRKDKVSLRNSKELLRRSAGWKPFDQCLIKIEGKIQCSEKYKKRVLTTIFTVFG